MASRIIHPVTSSATSPASVRWMIRKDYQQIVPIENASFERPWTEDMFVQVLKARHSIGMVAETQERIVGYIVYSMHQKELSIENLAVDPSFRRRRVGALLVNKLIAKALSSHNRDLICLAGDWNLPAHLFLRQCGFFCESIIRGYYDAFNEANGTDGCDGADVAGGAGGPIGDAYVFRWSATDWVSDRGSDDSDDDDCGDADSSVAEKPKPKPKRKRNEGR